MKEEIQKKLIDNSLNIVVTLLTMLFVLVGKEVLPLIAPSVLEKLTQKAILSLFLLSLTINCILCAWVGLLYYLNRHKLKLGMYWDKDLNPYCPVCKSPLGGYAEYMAGRGFNCIKCDEIVLLTAPDGSNPTLKEAITMMRA